MDDKALRRLRNLCGMFGSDHLGERANAARMANDLVRAHGMTWAEVIGAPPVAEDWHKMVGFCLRHESLLSPKELKFMESLGRFKKISEKQAKWLGDIVVRIEAITSEEAMA